MGQASFKVQSPCDFYLQVFGKGQGFIQFRVHAQFSDVVGWLGECLVQYGDQFHLHNGANAEKAQFNKVDVTFKVKHVFLKNKIHLN